MTAVLRPAEAGSDGQVKGEGGFPRPALLADDGDGLHGRGLQDVNPAILQACILSILHGSRIEASPSTPSRCKAGVRESDSEVVHPARIAGDVDAFSQCARYSKTVDSMSSTVLILA